MTDRIIAFADEFGNNSFDFENQGTHFIIATVMLKESIREDLESKVEEIRKRYFQTGEIKSSKVKDNPKRRLLILNDLKPLDFSIYAVIVDKRKLYGEGFKYKQVFYKFLNGLLYKELYRTFPQLQLTVDEHGGNDFMRGFKAYVNKNHIRTLFSGSDFNLDSSKDSVLIQLADLIAGTLGYIYDENKKSENSKDFLEIIQAKSSSFNFFPKEFDFKEIHDSNIDESFDPQIAELSYMRAMDFIDKRKGEDDETKDQISLIKLLILYHRAYNQNRFISTRELFNHLNASRVYPLKEEYFRTRLVGKLRDDGVLIASSRKGYKLPTSASDLDKFISHGKRIILPMINRIKICRDSIKLATNNQLDILDLPDYSELKKIIDK